MQVADKMKSGPFFIRFTNVDVSNDGYPFDIHSNYDCIAVKLDRSGSDRYIDVVDREEDIMNLAKKCGLPDGDYKFYVVDDEIGVIANINKGFSIDKVNESDNEFEKD